MGAHPPGTEPSLVASSQVPTTVTIFSVLSQADAAPELGMGLVRLRVFFI